jgi:hypothetical protein
LSGTSAASFAVGAIALQSFVQQTAHPGSIRIATARREPPKEGRVDNFEIKGQRLVALAMLGCLAFNYPILELFNRPGTVFGVPVLYAFIFAAWCLLIALMALVVETKDRADH